MWYVAEGAEAGIEAPWFRAGRDGEVDKRRCDFKVHRGSSVAEVQGVGRVDVTGRMPVRNFCEVPR